VAAVKAFKTEYYPLSISEQQEYGASIVKNPDGTYSFNNVSNSSMSAVDPLNMTDKERNTVSIDRSAPNSVGTIHTHWNPNGNLNFSNPRDYHEPSHVSQMYLINRNGEIYYSVRSKAPGNINGFMPGVYIGR